VQAGVGTIKALVPLYTIDPSLPIQRGQARDYFDRHEGHRDGIVYVGYESNRIKGEYLSSGKIVRSPTALGSLINIYV
jgi:hypothetical protein